jgi:hypothetical protein
MKLKSILVAAMFAAIGSYAVTAQAAEVRAQVGYQMGSLDFDVINGDDSVSAKLQGFSAGIAHYSEDSGPFLGVNLLYSKLRDFEINGEEVNGFEGDAHAGTLFGGYRIGVSGDVQPYIALGYTVVDDAADPVSMALGYEISTSDGRYQLSLNGSRSDQEKQASLGMQGVIYLDQHFGFVIDAEYGIGDLDTGGTRSDYSFWGLGLGIEYQFFM